MTDDVERRAIGAIFDAAPDPLILCYFVSIRLQSVVGFAAAQWPTASWPERSCLGSAPGLFFIGHFFFEVPPTSCWAARRAALDARIMISWGIVSAASSFCRYRRQAPVERMDLLHPRLLLGACEAGFSRHHSIRRSGSPVHRARATGPVHTAIRPEHQGRRFPGLLLNLSGLGLQGWQWLFVLE